MLQFLFSTIGFVYCISYIFRGIYLGLNVAENIFDMQLIFFLEAIACYVLKHWINDWKTLMKNNIPKDN